MDIRKLVGKRIKEIRTSLNLSQSKLAERTGLGDETISRIERGVQGVTLENLYRISQSLNIPLKSLLDIEESDESVSKDAVLQEIINLLQHSDERAILLTYKIVKAIIEADKPPRH